MQILLDKNNLIVGFAEVGSLENGIEIDNFILPSTFIAEFKKGKFIYSDNVVSYNRDFVDGDANALLQNTNESLEDKVKTLENRVKELEDIIANNQVPE